MPVPRRISCRSPLRAGCMAGAVHVPGRRCGSSTLQFALPAPWGCGDRSSGSVSWRRRQRRTRFTFPLEWHSDPVSGKKIYA